MQNKKQKKLTNVSLYVCRPEMLVLFLFLSDPYGGSDLEYPILLSLLLLLLLGPLGLRSNIVHLFTSDASQTHKTIYIPKAHDTYYPPVTQFVTDSDGDSDSDSDSDSDKDIMTERPNKCYIFENVMTQGYQI